MNHIKSPFRLMPNLAKVLWHLPWLGGSYSRGNAATGCEFLMTFCGGWGSILFNCSKSFKEGLGLKFASTFKIQNHKNVGDCVFSLLGNLIKDILLQVESLLQVAVAQLEAWCILKVHGNPKSDVFLFVGGGFSNIFHVHPAYLVKIPILTDIFQKGWNHQPVLVGGRLQIIADWMKSFSDGLKLPTSFWRMPRQFCKEWD